MNEEQVDVSAEEKVRVFIEALKRLCFQIKDLLKDTGYKIEEAEVDIAEERAGTYKAPSLTIYDSNGKVASIVPIGAWIIAADGRVDIKGKFSSEPLLLFRDRGGPVIETQEKVGDQYETNKKYIFKGVDDAGWYWLGSKVRSRAQKLNKELLLELISLVRGSKSNKELLLDLLSLVKDD
ncbi:MAG: hypothetical protein HQL06_02615 [Nitrospirae bacterium]|nr:hypothetical protein [Nitrospirota bacterium]